MNIFSGTVVFVLIWWMVFMCALPFGIKSIENPRDGTMPGAPLHPGLKRKALITTLLTVILWLVAYWLITSNFLSFFDIAQKMAT